MEKLQNAVIINGVVHELVDVVPDIQECEICSLREKCNNSHDTICFDLFYDAVHKMFKERTDL